MVGVVFILKAKPLVVITLLLGGKLFFTFGMRSSRYETRSRWWFDETTCITLFFTNFVRSLLLCNIEYAPSDLIARCEQSIFLWKIWGKERWDPV